MEAVGQLAGRFPPARFGSQRELRQCELLQIGPDSRHYPASEQRLSSISDTLARKK